VRVSTVLAALPRELDAVVMRAGHRFVIATAPDRVVSATGEAALGVLDDLPAGWWAGYLSYDLGRAVERVRARPGGAAALPDLLLARFPARLVLDPATGEVEIAGTGDVAALLERSVACSSPPSIEPTVDHHWRSSLERQAFEAGVRRVLDAITAGDCYQVNLCRRLTSPTAHDPVALFASLEARNPAPHGAFVRVGAASDRPAVAIVSASPERFLVWRGREVETCPIKGTGTEPDRLVRSAKDRAENVMIVDLARNDLGRVCEPGSISVPALCAVESHPGLHHLVSTVRGRRRFGSSVGALIRASFPPASVTGAPKPRVMQIIEDLEPVRRGVYCGAVGWIDTERDEGDLNVAIRTFVVEGGRTHLGVGAGIVADSDPSAEWDETELKASRLLAAAASSVGAEDPRRSGTTAPTLARPA
jgi:para-aminobenzoate synthetase component 1